MSKREYETKDSGQRIHWDSGMHRDTQTGKPRFDLCFPLDVPYDEQLFVRFAELMARGAEKYGDRNWEQANSEEEVRRFKGSALRHFMQWYLGEEDEDHAAAVLFNITGAEYAKRRVA